SRREIQLLLRDLLLEEALLEKSFRRDPSIARAWIQFFINEIALAEMKGEILSALSFLDMSLLIKAIADKMKIEDLSSLSLRDYYHTWLLRNDLDTERKAGIHMYRLASYAYEPSLTLEGAIECLESHFYRSIYIQEDVISADMQLRLLARD